ncbi:MAG TPA: rod shape-determining protein [Phycicoccus elongatus]|uniref:rod shape-determining protein n=1 Tax=Phycicoccus TaxID=367298 RepID=UPI00258312B6|nr:MULTISPECIES: rod shape-determining protein [Phycicoccus]HPF76432.1 rod shape-determining protein [Phycicoccus elongatus]HPK12456.1 rod shape-determining protein [Phycicoccus elongatus]HPQ73917.1 rod shape-determining protein [Phycicoccus elongatus]HRV57612.1 rod shape-determining protein [Phycicoccus sp.]
MASVWGRFGGRDLAIDLGTANTVIYQRGRGVVLDEPSVVAVRTGTADLLAAGARAKEMVGRTPSSVTAIRPLRDGVISDAEVSERMLRWFVDQVAPSTILRPRVVVGVPSDITGVERRALEDATLRAGARRVYVIEEPMAAALGAGLPIHETAASMVVDIGGGTTDVAVISLGGVVSARSVRIGGDEIDEAIVAHVKGEYSLLLGERTAEHIKVTAGSAFPLREEVNERVRGRDLATGLPKTVVINSAEVRRAIELPLHQIIDLVRGVLDVCPPELAGDILDRGITLTGGGALLRGLDQRLHHELGVPVTVAEDPLRAVARGAGRCVEEFSTLQRVLVDTTRR